MENQSSYTYDVIQVCLLAGKVMLQNGGETYRVEDTMTRIADACGATNSNSYVTPTGIFFSLEGPEPSKTQLIRISERTTDLDKVTKVNSISRRISSGDLSIQNAHIELDRLDKMTERYTFSKQLIAAAIASGCFLIMFQGSWNDFVPAVLAGGGGFFSVNFFNRLVPIKFFSEFLASFVIGLLAVFFVSTGLGEQLDKIIIGSVMPLVPGLLITNAVRDLMAGHLISGLSKGAEAFLTAFAIGAGIAIVVSFL
ncbi:threonine/serine exporter family protein [Pseudalkalibacillus hwajinpoensis]|uniref:Threonine/serine exporter family protein n=1 Tax=Guptibacillus hwajinpoensis TaxID=208199 RepID=A0A4U1MD65_9BACL|nr:threonine/serine exporter family protein [Pseudalkalibacillus hwajinpoensis]TKD68272.1 threonine/serine exporter family protein [Pseudalkalibacillus hwajinpoensis]